jgi:HEAT repeat protein
MMNAHLKVAALAAGTALTATTSSATEKQAVDDLIAKLKDPDDKVRGPAWQSAGSLGAPAVKTLANTMTDADMEVARAAKRGLWKIVRYAGRP